MERIQLTVDGILQEVALRNGVSIEEVQKEINLAILAGSCHPNPRIQAKWKTIPCTEAVPTPEELVKYLSASIIKKPKNF